MEVTDSMIAMNKSIILSLLFLVACGVYYHGAVTPYQDYNEVSYTNKDKSYSQKWALADAQLWCNGGVELPDGTANKRYTVISSETTYSGIMDENTDKVVQTVAGVASTAVIVAGALKKDKNVIAAGAGTGLVTGAAKGDYTTIIRFRCQ